MKISFPPRRGCGRFAFLLLIVAIAVAVVPSGSRAAAGSHGGPGFDRIDQALREGRLTYSQALNYKVDALFHPKDIPDEFRPTRPLKSGTPIIREALAHREYLTAKNLKALLRPTDAGDCPPTFSSQYCLYFGSVVVQSYASPGGNFRLHYTTDNTYGDAVSSTDADDSGVPDYVESYARFLDDSWNHEVDTLGFSAPPSDDPRGGDGRRDVYIKNLRFFYGITLFANDPADGADPAGAYMIVENDYAEDFPTNENGLCAQGNTSDCQEGAMKVTAAHEFFHVIQWQISTNCQPSASRDLSNCWWMEASATWMEDGVFPEAKDYLNYLDNWFLSPEMSLDTYNGGYEYGTVVWAKYLSEKYGIGIIKEIWLAIDDPLVNALEAIRQVLTAHGSSLAAELREFRGKNGALIYWDTPYADGASYPGSVNLIYGDDATENYTDAFQGDCSAATGDCLLDPLSAYYYLFSANNLTQSGSLTVSYQGKSGSVAVLVLPMTNALGVPVTGSDTYPVTSEVSLTGAESGTLTVTPFGPTVQYKQVMVVVLNTGESSSTGILTVCSGAISCSGGSGGNSASSGNDDRCFIATAAYGSPLHPYVQLLREFRDRYLLTHPAGTAFVEFYYRHSPPLARRIAEDPVLKGATEAALIPAVAFAAFMVKTTLLEKGLFFLVVWWGLKRRRRKKAIRSIRLCPPLP